MRVPLLAVSLGFSLLLQSSAIDDLSPELEAIRKEFDLPAIAAVMTQDGKIIAEGVAGTRRLHSDIPATLDDRFHLGSDTKAMTALLAAMLVEKGKLRWDLTLAEAFPEYLEKIPEPLRNATLEQILSHSSGLPGDNEELFKIYYDSIEYNRPLPQQRLWVIEQALKLPPAGKPGEQFVYSNLGYIVAGSIIERAAGKSWEELMHERIFTPLGLTSAGLGPQSSLGLIDAPIPHFTEDGEIFPMLGGPSADVPAVMGPAGNAHMSPRDFARWAAWHAAVGKRNPALVSPKSVEKLHTPVIETPPRMEERPGTPRMGRYALGWGIIRFPWEPEKDFLMHGGSNSMNLAWIIVRPEEDRSLVLMTNIGGQNADRAFQKLSGELWKKFFP